MIVVQCEFIYVNGNEWTKTIAWVDASWNLKEGLSVRFKDDPRQWTVNRVYQSKMDVAQIEQTWLVGGNEEVTARKEQKVGT